MFLFLFLTLISTVISQFYLQNNSFCFLFKTFLYLQSKYIFISFIITMNTDSVQGDEHLQNQTSQLINEEKHANKVLAFITQNILCKNNLINFWQFKHIFEKNLNKFQTIFNFKCYFCFFIEFPKCQKFKKHMQV